MNKVILMGRLTRDPDIRYSAAENSVAYARYILAVDRRVSRKDNDQQTADFISCVTFGKGAEFAEKYLRQGIKIVVTGRIQTGSYTNRDGQKVYTTDVVVEEQEFAESKSAQNGGGNGQGTGGAASQRSGGAAAQGSGAAQQRAGTAPQGGQREDYRQQSFVDGDGFMNLPEGIDEELPFT